jgi:tetratricopeptide (TPR) repeat protein
MIKNILTALLLCVSFFASAQTLEEGVQHLNNDNLKAAQAAFEKIILTTPDNGRAYYYLGEVFFRQGKIDEAKKLYDRGVDAAGKDPFNYIGQAKVLLENNDVKGAEKLIERSLNASKRKNPEVYSAITDAYLRSKNKNFDAAVRNATSARDLDPRVVKYAVGLGNAQLAAGNHGAAMNAFEDAIAKDPKNTEVLMSMAKIWAQSNPIKAIEYLEQLIKLDDKDANAYRMLGDLYQRTGKFDKVPLMLDKYLELAGNDTYARMNLIRYLSTFMKENADRIIQESKTILKTEPENWYVMRFLARGYGEKAQHQLVLDTYDKFNKLKPADVLLESGDQSYIVSALIELDKMDEANVAIAKLLVLDTSRVDIYTTLGKKYAANRDYVKAIEYFKLKIEKTPKTDVSDYVNLGEAYYNNKNYAECATAYGKVVELSPIYYFGYYRIATSTANQDNDETPAYIAKPQYQVIIDKLENNTAALADPYNKNYLVQAYIYMGYAQVSATDYPGAIAFFNKALVLDPTNATVLGVLQQMKEQGLGN